MMEFCLLPDQSDKIIRTPKLEYEFSKQSLGKVLFESMKKYENQIAQIDSKTGASIAYGELLQQCVRTAIELKNWNVKIDDIICVNSHNQLKACVPYLAGLFVGARVYAIDPGMPAEDISYLLNQIPPKMIFTTEGTEKILTDIVENLQIKTQIVSFGKSKTAISFDEFLTPKQDEDAFSPVDINDVFKTAIIFFSSGTTGFPKGICISHYSILNQSVIFNTLGYDLRVSLGFAPLLWISSINILITCVIYGHTRLLCQFDAQQVWYLLDKYKVTFLLISSTQAFFVIKSKKPNSKFEYLKNVCVGAAPVSIELFSGLKRAFPNTYVTQGYGWTEVGGIITFSRAKCPKDIEALKNKPRSCGRPLPGLWYKIVDIETEETVGPNRKGELRLKTDYEMNGYFNMDSSCAWDSEGWLKTGDVCYYDEDSCFYVVGRIKELIKYRGWHISPAVLEEILLKHPAVKMAVVIGVPHEVDNEHPLAVVMLMNDKIGKVSEKQLQKYVDDQVDETKKLRAGVVFIDSIPETPTGKIRRYYLKTQILSQMV